MQSSNQPGKISLPFAASGAKQPIPVASQVGIEDGRASYTDGFPPLTRTPLAAGGKPPFGTDMNGILNSVTAIQQWQSAGGGFKYDAVFSASISGYPAGAMLVRADNSGLWVNTIDGNVSDPDAGGAGWQPAGSGTYTAAMSSANVTLTALQASQSIIIITGILTANLQLVFPAYRKQWIVVNRATGAFTVTCKTASVAGVSILTGTTQAVYCDGTDMLSATTTTTQQSIVGGFSNLKSSSTGTSAIVTLTADEVSLEAAAGSYLTVRGVNLTAINISGAGANGLDVGISAQSTWYSLWVISNGTTTAGLLSLSTSSPTMPAGYTFKARVGWVRTDSTANKYPLRYVQAGTSFQYAPAAATNLTSAPVMISGASGNPVSPPTWAAVSVSPFIPPTASRIRIYVTGYNGGTIAAPNNSYGGLSTSAIQGAPIMVSPPAGNSASNSSMGDFILESTNIYYASGGAASSITCIGYEDNV